MRIILTRHGRTEENDAWILQGHIPGTLSENGWIQAQKVAERLKSEKIDFVYSSDLARSANTAKEIIKYHPETPIEFTEELREAFLGGWQWKTKTEVEFFNSLEGESMAPKDFESPGALIQRAEKFLKRIFPMHQGETILLVGHNGINKKLVHVLTGEDPIESLKNTSISIFEMSEDGWVHTVLFNCTKHLD